MSTVLLNRPLAAQAAPLADAIVFAKVKARLGGRVRLVASGSAPLAGHVEEFLKTVMCAPVAQGYGLTETCGSSFIALPEPVHCFSSLPAHCCWPLQDDPSAMPGRLLWQASHAH